jgi:hypothetical protein
MGRRTPKQANRASARRTDKYGNGKVPRTAIDEEMPGCSLPVESDREPARQRMPTVFGHVELSGRMNLYLPQLGVPRTAVDRPYSPTDYGFEEAAAGKAVGPRALRAS